MVCEDLSRYQNSVTCSNNYLKKKSYLGKSKEQKNENSENREARFKLYKADFCLFHQNGACNRGERCTFAHYNSELRDRPDLLKTRMCKDYLQNGSCKIDQLCTFAHGEKELKTIDENIKDIKAQQNNLHIQNSAFKKVVGEKLTNNLFEKASKSKNNKRNNKEEKIKALSCTLKPFLEEKEVNNSARCKFLANKFINNKVVRRKLVPDDNSNNIKDIVVEENNCNSDKKNNYGSNKVNLDCKNSKFCANSSISMINSCNYKTEINIIKNDENKERNENENKKNSKEIEEKLNSYESEDLVKNTFFEHNNINNSKSYSYNDLFYKEKDNKKGKNVLLTRVSNTIIKEAYDINNMKRNNVDEGKSYSFFSENGNYMQDKGKLCLLEEETADCYGKVSNNNDFFVDYNNFSSSSYCAELSTLVLTCESSSSSPSSSTPISFCGSISNNNYDNKIEESGEETELKEKDSIDTQLKEEQSSINKYNSSSIVEENFDVGSSISCFSKENEKEGKNIVREKGNFYATNENNSNTASNLDEMCLKEEKIFNLYSNQDEVLFDIDNIKSKYDDNIFYANLIKNNRTSVYEHDYSAIRKCKNSLKDSEKNKIIQGAIFENERTYTTNYDYISSADSDAQRNKDRTKKEEKQAKESIQKKNVFSEKAKQKITNPLNQNLSSGNFRNFNHDNNNEMSNPKIPNTLTYNDHYFSFLSLPSNFLFFSNENQANNSIIYNKHHMIHPLNFTNQECNYIQSEQEPDNFLLSSPYVCYDSQHENIIKNPFYISPILNNFLYANQHHVFNNPNDHTNMMQNNMLLSKLNLHIPKNSKIKEQNHYFGKLIKDKYFCEKEKQNNPYLRKCLYFLSFHYKLSAFHTSFNSSLLETKYLQDAMPVMYEE